MPTTYSSAKGYSGLVVETASGLQQLLTPTLVSALPASLTNSTPLTNAPSGMHLLIRAYNHTASGTIIVTGTAPYSVAVATETTTTLPVPETPGTYIDYPTSTVFGAVNASGVTLGGGLTNGSIAIYGIQAATRMLVGEVKLNDKRTEHTPVAQRGDYSESHTGPLPMSDDPDWEYQADFWPDDSLFILQGGFNSALTAAQQPTTAIAVLTATSVTTAGNASASIQPTAPGMIVKAVLSAGITTAATVSVTGTNLYGQTITEVITPSTKTPGTWYSNNVFASIAANGIAWGAFGGGTVTVTAMFGWALSGNAGDGLSTFALCQYDSVGSYIAPWCTVSEWTIEGGMDKECKVTAKGPCQAVLKVGNFATNTSQVPALAQPLDEPIMGWRTEIFIDGINGTAGATPQVDCTEFKIACNNKLKAIHKSSWNPVARWFGAVYRGRREIAIELKLDMTSATYQNEYAGAFTRGTKRLIQIQVQGSNQLGTTGGVTYVPGWTITLPIRWEADPGRTFTMSQENVQLALKGRAYLDPAIGYDLNIVNNSRYFTW